MAAILTSRRALLLTCAALAAGCDAPPPPSPAGGGERPAFKGVDITGAAYARTLALPDVDGQPRNLADFKGKAVLVFFGYTQCPDVCPTTLSDLAEAKRQLGREGDKVQGVFVSVDPERDTPQVLKAYVGNFGPGFVALRGTPEQTQAAAREFKVFYAKVPGKTADAYTIDHTAGAYLFDPAGRVRLFTRYGSGPQALAADLKLLVEGA